MMQRESLLEALARYSAFDTAEREMVSRLTEFVGQHEDCFRRTLTAGHVTGSAWILDLDRSHTLLTFHRKLGRWLQLGGHWEEGEQVLETALREAHEESGLAVIRPISYEIFDIDIHPIPPKNQEPEHLHYDVRFVFEADRRAALMASPESRELAWVPLHRVGALNSDPCIARMVAKSAALA